MVTKRKCPACGREFAYLESHILRTHTADTELPANVDNDPETAIASGDVLQTSHNTPNPDAPPPSYTPATTSKETS